MEGNLRMAFAGQCHVSYLGWASVGLLALLKGKGLQNCQVCKGQAKLYWLGWLFRNKLASLLSSHISNTQVMALQGLLSSALFGTCGSFISCGLMNASSLCTVSGLGEMLVDSQLLTAQFPNFLLFQQYLYVVSSASTHYCQQLKKKSWKKLTTDVMRNLE